MERAVRLPAVRRRGRGAAGWQGPTGLRRGARSGLHGDRVYSRGASVFTRSGCIHAERGGHAERGVSGTRMWFHGELMGSRGSKCSRGAMCFMGSGCVHGKRICSCEAGVFSRCVCEGGAYVFTVTLIRSCESRVMCGPCKWVEEHSPPLVGAAAARMGLGGPFTYQICLLYDRSTVSLSICLFNAPIPKKVPTVRPVTGQFKSKH